MTRLRRRDVLAGGVALTALTAGCLSGGSDTQGTVEPGTPEFGTIAGSETPSAGQSLSVPVAGDPDADVTVSSYEDYACPHCATYSVEVFPQLATAYLEPGTVRYEFRDFPIPVDETVSWQAASAARAVQAAAGPQAFFVYAERLFRNQSDLDPSAYATLTDGLAVDGETVRQAATDRRYDETVRADRQQGLDRGVQGTPMVFVNGDPVEWQEIAYDPVREAIEAARSE